MIRSMRTPSASASTVTSSSGKSAGIPGIRLPEARRMAYCSLRVHERPSGPVRGLAMDPAPPPPAADHRLRGALLVALAAMLWSSGGLFIKVAPMPALAVACGRAAITALFYLAVLRPNLRQA